jgi:serine kinase of HPr protein (carbohydrate metabolism regulator)
VNDKVPVSGTLDVHATCVELTGGGKRAGALLTGPSGSGKSSLALRLVDQPGYGAGGNEPISAQMVADDRVRLFKEGGVLMAAPLPSASGMSEVRGLGVLQSNRSIEPVALAICVEHAESWNIERMPPQRSERYLGLNLPAYRLDFRAPSAPAELRTLMLVHWGLVKLLND